jgi:rSAM/selenodomain-associated transferase 1
MNQDRCILLFVKYPEKGMVKLRLAADLHEEHVVQLYRCFVHDTLETVKRIDTDLFICFTPVDTLPRFQGWLGSHLRFLPQNGNDLGERMRHCFATVFAHGYHHAILMGSDSPDLPEDYVTKGFSLLKTNDVVLGPATDGGYYLIGLSNTTGTQNLFEDLPWGTSTVLQETLGKIRLMNHTVGLLPDWSDVDTITDLKHLIVRSQNTAFKSSQTMTYIHTHHINLEDDDEK